MKLRIAVLPGDGIGPEVTRQAIRVLRAVAAAGGHEFHFRELPVGGVAIRQFGTPLPSSTLDECLASDAVLLGAVGAPEFDGLTGDKRPESGLLRLRQGLGGFANLRPSICFAPLAGCSPLRPEIVRGADILIVRELLGGLYFGQPRGITEQPSAGFNTMRYSAEEIERVARVAFLAARERRKKLTSVDKANVLETSQLWRRVVARVATEYPEIKLDNMYVDACAMRLVTHPTSFDVVLTENLFGDILSDEASVLTGSLGMLGSATIGGAIDLYEPVHGSAPDIAGRGIANPLGAIASAAMLLRYTGHAAAEAGRIEAAVQAVLEAGYRTADIAGAEIRPVSTEQMGALVERALTEPISRQQSNSA